MNKSVTLISLTAVALSSVAQAEIDWSRVENNNTNYAIDFDDITSGTIGLAAHFGFSETEYTERPTASFTADPAPMLESVGDSVSLLYTLAETIDGGTFSFGGWKDNDYEITLSGGDGVFDTSNVMFGANNDDFTEFVPSANYAIQGNGTNSILLDNLGADQEFVGSFDIVGTWDTLEIKQKYNDDGNASSPVLKNASMASRGLTVKAVPEPSSASLLLLGSLSLVLRRRR